MMKFSSRFCLWHLLVALASLSAASPQSRVPSQLYDTPQRPSVAFPPPQSRPPTSRFPTVPPSRPSVFPPISSQNPVATQGAPPPQPTRFPSFPSVPSVPAEPDRLYAQPDPARVISNPFGPPTVPSNDIQRAPRPFPPPSPTQLYEQPAGDASDDRRGSVVFPNLSPGQSDDFPAPPAPPSLPGQRPLPSPTPTGAPSAMQGMPYDFNWGVQDAESGNIYSHAESSDGTVTRGEYRVLLPDGRLQLVQFVDRGNGYEAKVTYEVYDGQLPLNF